jgi:hypothetical protein
MLNELLPGICSKILDAVLRNVVSFNIYPFCIPEFLKISELDTYRFSAEPYRLKFYNR